MIASAILMILTLALMLIGILPPTTTIPVMILWSSLGIMTEIRRANPRPKKPVITVTDTPEDDH